MNKQPAPEKSIDRNLQGNRKWRWWSLIVLNTILFDIDDIIIIDNVKYRIVSLTNWNESGFQKYTAIEDYS